MLANELSDPRLAALPSTFTPLAAAWNGLAGAGGGLAAELRAGGTTTNNPLDGDTSTICRISTMSTFDFANAARLLVCVRKHAPEL